MAGGLSFADPLGEDEDGEFTELVDAVIDRVDLVGKAANGTRFLIAKSAAPGGGIMPAATVRELIKQAQGGPHNMPIPTTVPRTVPATGKPQIRVVKASGKPQMAVYDENGKLLGLIDPKDLTKVLTSAGDDEHEKQDANAARVAAQHAPPSPAEQAQTAAGDVVKAMNAALAPVKPRPGLVAKALGGTPVTAAFGALLKELDDSRQDVLKATVSAQSMRLMTGFGLPADRAITLCQREAVLAARRKGLI